jgi:hypothetical protein
LIINGLKNPLSLAAEFGENYAAKLGELRRQTHEIMPPNHFMCQRFLKNIDIPFQKTGQNKFS